MDQFARRLDEIPELKRTIDKAAALLWFAGRESPSEGLSAQDVARALVSAGHPDQNVSRLRQQLEADSRTARAGSDCFRLRPAARRTLDVMLAPLVKPLASKASDSVIPQQLATRSRRGYLQKVVHQVNVSYDQQLFDCTAVMLRRLIETLVIEVYERAGIPERIKSSAGFFFMLDDLLRTLETDHQRFHLGRNSQRGLRELKDLGDKSAHNRRFNATQADIDRLRSDIRTAVEELIHLAGLDGADQAFTA